MTPNELIEEIRQLDREDIVSIHAMLEAELWPESEWELFAVLGTVKLRSPIRVSGEGAALLEQFEEEARKQRAAPDTGHTDC